MPPIMTMRSSKSCILFIAINGCLIINQHNKIESIEGDFIDAAIGTDIIIALGTNGAVYSIEKGIPVLLFNQQFVRSIAIADNTPIILHSKRKCTIIQKGSIENIDLPFEFEYVSSGKEAIIAGHGQMMIYGDERHIIKYNERIGTLYQIIQLEKSYVFIGSASRPVLRFKSQKTTEIKPNLIDLQTIAKSYPISTILPMFESPLYSCLLQCSYGDLSLLKLPNDMTSLIEYIPYFNQSVASHLIHVLLSNNVILNDDLLCSTAARNAIVEHEEDIKLLPQAQMELLIKKQQNKKMGRHKHIDSLTTKLLQNFTSSISIPSRKVKESQALVIFSCGHVIKKDELNDQVKTVTDYCSTKGKETLALELTQVFSQTKISTQCPCCLLRVLKNRLEIVN